MNEVEAVDGLHQKLHHLGGISDFTFQTKATCLEAFENSCPKWDLC